MTNVMPFPSGGGPEDPMLEQRVARLESDMGEIKSTLKAIDSRLGAIEVALAEMKGRLGGIEGRLQQIPTVWQTISILAVLLFGVAGVIFAAGNFLRP
ncbi:MAG: hypothetical protein H7Y62_15405 [Hyphomicrobium sp.]|nr:hypothetical protein [Hyphomicrobium sp.]